MGGARGLGCGRRESPGGGADPLYPSARRRLSTTVARWPSSDGGRTTIGQIPRGASRARLGTDPAEPERGRAVALTLGLCIVAPLFMWLLVDDDARAASLFVAGPSGMLHGPVATAPPAGALAARLIARPAPYVIALGTAQTVSVAFLNTGSAPWIRRTRAEARLGIIADDTRFADLGLARGWLAADRPAAQAEGLVGPGAVATFSFTVYGRVSGTYTIPVGLVVEGVKWIDGATTSIDIVIR